MTDLSHLRVQGTARSVRYTHPGVGGGATFRLPPRDRVPHARRLRSELEDVEREAQELRRQETAQEEPIGEVIAVRSDRDFELKVDSLERRTSGIELVSVKQEDGVTVAKLFIPRGKYVRLLSLIDAYADQEGQGRRPKNQKLIESIASIRLAAVRDFWQDSIPLPPVDRAIWWEVWLRAGTDPQETHRRFSERAGRAGLRVSEQFVRFPERLVVLAHGNQQQVGSSVDLLALMAELRQAKELATTYDSLAPRDQADFVNDAARRLVVPHERAPAVCLLDTGVNREHPLIAPALAIADAQSVKPEWGSADDGSHGTGMAGIALYGCLTRILSSTDPIVLRHRLESVKLLPPPPGANDPRDWGPFTSQAVSLAELQAPRRKRAICMAITADDRDQGVPSLWSADVDQMCSGALGDEQRLMCISAGNLGSSFHDASYLYTGTNEQSGVEDPGQAWNALTVGAFTERVFIQDPAFAGWNPVAPSGDLCPTSRTSLPWEDVWPFKPDIVVEGGNYAQRGNERSECEDLSLLTTSLESTGRLLKITHDTSPATAWAARMAATIWSHYPRLAPETIRALMVHSARWTPAMLERFPGNNKAMIQRRLRCFGYGVPDLQRALWSAENAVTLIFEGEIQPYSKDPGKDVRTHEMHRHELPWPVEVLEELGGTDVTMRVTLSYFIEPSPGRIGWKEKHRYQSHGLRFDVIRPTEDAQAFAQRLSRAVWATPTSRPTNAAESRSWVIGEQGRTRGSIHSDWWTGTAADLASCGQIAVYPVTGWWRERAHLGKWGERARYSLVITIEAPGVETDLYTPISTETAVTTEVDVTAE